MANRHSSYTHYKCNRPKFFVIPLLYVYLGLIDDKLYIPQCDTPQNVVDLSNLTPEIDIKIKFHIFNHKSY